VVEALERHGSQAIIALAGVPGTGKSYIASIAAQRFTTEPLLVREIQFHQSFTYEEFIEGMRIDDLGTVKVLPGIFLEWNGQAADDPDHRYVLLIEELTRANLPAVLGELLTYLEYRDRPFYAMYSRKPVRVSENLTILATYNPTDRSALEVDAALLRRLRVLTFPPSIEQLGEMLTANGLPKQVTERIAAMFKACENAFGAEYELGMPFGHGLFAGVMKETDLYELYVQRIRHMLRRPLLDPHPFTDTVEKHYPWTNETFRVPAPAEGNATPATSAPAPASSTTPDPLTALGAVPEASQAATRAEPPGVTEVTEVEPPDDATSSVPGQDVPPKEN
jgi:GTPase subunit of restriction endonuclease